MAVVRAFNGFAWIVGAPLVWMFWAAGMTTAASVVAALLLCSLANVWGADRRARRADLALAYVADQQIYHATAIFADALARRAGR